MNCFEEKQPKKQTKIENVKKKGLEREGRFSHSKKERFFAVDCGRRKGKSGNLYNTPKTHTVIILIIIQKQIHSQLLFFIYKQFCTLISRFVILFLSFP